MVTYSPPPATDARSSDVATTTTPSSLPSVTNRKITRRGPPTLLYLSSGPTPIISLVSLLSQEVNRALRLLHAERGLTCEYSLSIRFTMPSLDSSKKKRLTGQGRKLEGILTTSLPSQDKKSPSHSRERMEKVGETLNKE